MCTNYFISIHEKNCDIHSDETIRQAVGLPLDLFGDPNLEYLQNIQNCALNSMRYKVGEDDLQSVTRCYTPQQTWVCKNDSDESYMENDVAVLYNLFMSHLNPENSDDQNPVPFHQKLDKYKSVGWTNFRCAERRCQSRIVEKTKDVEREDLWRFVVHSDLISLSIDNRLY
jgi:hypothetical protein